MLAKRNYEDNCLLHVVDFLMLHKNKVEPKPVQQCGY